MMNNFIQTSKVSLDLTPVLSGWILLKMGMSWKNTSSQEEFATNYPMARTIQMTAQSYANGTPLY